MFGLQARKLLAINNTRLTFYMSKHHHELDTMEPYVEKNPPQDIWADKKDPRYTDVEEVHGRWHYVERLFPKLRIPEPPGHESSVGWKPPPAVAPDLPYFVRRTRNHMLPVFKSRVYKERLLVTQVTKIQGDIWLFEHDLKSYLKNKHKCDDIKSHVNEIACYINVGGDYIEDIKTWLYDKGF